MTDQAPLHTFHTRCHSCVFRSLEASVGQFGLVSGLIVDPPLVPIRKSSPQTDDLCDLLLVQVECLTDGHQVLSQILHLIPARNAIGSNYSITITIAEEGVEEAEQGAAEETAEEAGQSAEEETAEEAEQGAAVFGWMWVAVVRMVLVQRDRG